MSESCNCFEDSLAKVKELAIKSIIPDNASADSLEVEWQNKVLRLDGGKNDVMLKIDCEYQQIKKDKTPYRNKTTKTISISMTFCPMCGTKFAKQ